MVKNPPANVGDVGDEVQPLGQKDPLEEAWKPTLVFLPGAFHGQRSLAGYSLWTCKETRPGN